MSSPIWIPNKSLNEQCAKCGIECEIHASSRTKYDYGNRTLQPTCGCPYGIHNDPIMWIQ